MPAFASILLLVVLALLGGSRIAFRVRRAPLAAMLEHGGWVAMGVGVLIGPSGVGLVREQTIDAITPLLLMGLGQIGLLVGLGIRRETVLGLPRSAVLAALVDSAVSLVLFGGLGLIALLWWTRPDDAWVLAGGVVLLACASVGWSMETRSLRVADHAAVKRLGVQLRGAASLAVAVAVAVYGPLSALRPAGTEGVFGAPLTAVGVQAAGGIGVGVVMGVAGRFLLGLTGRSRGDRLAVMLGIVAMVTGVAMQLGLSAIFAAMVAGAMIANLRGLDLRTFERFVLKTELIIATLFWLLAGVLLSMAPGWNAVGLAVGIALIRFACKPWLFRLTSGRASDERTSGGSRRSPLWLAPARQAPIAIVLGVSAVIVDPSAFNRSLLTTIALAGVLSDVLVLVASGVIGKRRAAGDAEGSP